MRRAVSPQVLSGLLILLPLLGGTCIFLSVYPACHCPIHRLPLPRCPLPPPASRGGKEGVAGVAPFGGFKGFFGRGETSKNIPNSQTPPVTLWLPGMVAPFEFKI